MRKITLLVCCLLSSLCFAKVSIEQWQTQNGTRVLFVNAPDVPMLDIKIAFNAGSAYDGDAFGLSALTADLLTQGSQGKSADEIADMFADSGAQVSGNNSRDMAIVSLRTLTTPKALAKALTTFESVLNHPDFPSDAVKRVKNQQLAGIRQEQQSPNSVANIAFFNQLYGKHPYAHPVIGTEKTVSELKKKQVKAFYQQYFVGDNATMAIVGAISKQQAKGIAEQLTHNMPKGKKAAALPKAEKPASLSTQKITFPSSQTAIRLGQLGITHHAKDYFPLFVGNYTLGGGMLVSRLAFEIREKRGLSYGISSLFLPLPAVGPFVINLATKTQQAQDAITVTEQTLQQFVSQGPSDAELTAAKQYLTGSFPLSLASNNAIATMLLKIGFYRLPMDFIDTYVAKVKAVSKEQIKQAFKQHLQPKQMLLVTVGKEVATSPNNNVKK